MDSGVKFLSQARRTELGLPIHSTRRLIEVKSLQIEPRSDDYGIILDPGRSLVFFLYDSRRSCGLEFLPNTSPCFSDTSASNKLMD